MPLGLQGPMGLQGGYEALAKIIAERKKDEILRFEQEQQLREFQLQQERQDEQRSWQRLQFEALENERRGDRTFQQNELAHRRAVEARTAASQVRDDERAKWKGTAGNTPVSATEFIAATQDGAVPRGQFEPEQIPVDPRTGQAVEGVPQQWRFEGGAEWENKQQDRLLREKALQRPQMIPVKITNPQTGVEETIMVDKHQTSHMQSLGPTAIPPGQQTKVIDAQIGLHGVQDISNTYRPEFVGPAQGWLTKLGIRTGHTADIKKMLEGSGGGLEPITDEFAAFVAAVQANKNRTIREITGAALGGTREEIRILGEIPDFTDPPKIFLSKLQRIESERRKLLQIITQRQMMGLETPGFGPGAQPEGEGGVVPGAAPKPRVTKVPTRIVYELDANGNLVEKQQ